MLFFLTKCRLLNELNAVIPSGSFLSFDRPCDFDFLKKLV